MLIDILKKVQGLLLKWMLILSYLVFMIKFGAHATIGAVSPANPPSYGPFINPSHPPKSSHFSIQFKKRSEWKPPISGFKDIAPIRSTEAAVPSVLAQPPLTHQLLPSCSDATSSRTQQHHDLTVTIAYRTYTTVCFSRRYKISVRTLSFSLTPLFYFDFSMLE